MFSFFKKLFGRGVSLKSQQKQEFVHFHKLKGGYLKKNTSIFVDNGFMAVVFYYDKLCDILNAGEHRFTETGMPILTKHNKPRKTRNGLIFPKKVKADIYFVNLKTLENLTTKVGRIATSFDNKNKKIKAYFSYDLQALNPSKMLVYLLLDASTVKNDEALKEIDSYVKDAIKNLLNINLFELEKYIEKHISITELLNSYINKSLSELGVNINNIKILQIKMPKKLQEEYVLQKETSKALENENLKEFIENKIEKPETQSTMVSIPVYARENVKQMEQEPASEPLAQSETKTENVYEKATSPEINFEETYKKYLQELEKHKDYQPQEKNENLENIVSVFSNETNTKESISNVKESINEVFEPQINVETKTCKFCGAELPKTAKFCHNCGKNAGEFKLCKSCGAKNFPDATTCIFCKSDLD